MLEDVDELMPAKPCCGHAESAIPPLEETDIAAVHSVLDAKKFSLLISRDEEIDVLRSPSRWNPSGGAYDNSANRNTGETTLAFAGGDSRIEIPTAPTKNPKSGTVTSTPDDAELLKDMRGLVKPQLFDESDTDASSFLVSEDDSTLLRHMNAVVDTSPDKCHRHRGFRRNGQPEEPAHRDTADSIHRQSC